MKSTTNIFDESFINFSPDGPRKIWGDEVKDFEKLWDDFHSHIESLCIPTNENGVLTVDQVLDKMDVFYVEQLEDEQELGGVVTKESAILTHIKADLAYTIKEHAESTGDKSLLAGLLSYIKDLEKLDCVKITKHTREGRFFHGTDY